MRIGALVSGATALLFCGTLSAAEYELPADDGWYQLQDPSTYETVCQTGDPQPCDVAPGVYALINFNIPPGEDGHRDRVRIQDRPSGGAVLAFETRLNVCLDATACEVTCPVQTPDPVDPIARWQVVSSLCTAQRDGAGVAPFSHDYGGGSAGCSTSETVDQISVKVSCLKTGLESFAQ